VAGRIPRLYAIVDSDVCAAAGRRPLEVAHAYFAAGVRLLQIRAKQANGRDLLAMVDAVSASARDFGAEVIVNDRVDVAASAAAGVHVGQDDLPPAVARRLLGPRALIGCSTHTPAQLSAALAAPVDYVAFGPVFATSTKTNPDPIVGLDAVRSAARHAAAAGVPLVAIGGITLATAPAVVGAGATAVAVITDLLCSDEPPESRARRFLVALDAGGV
jgi:thiamine-phosphate pyrophosphorylase